MSDDPCKEYEKAMHEAATEWVLAAKRESAGISELTVEEVLETPKLIEETTFEGSEDLKAKYDEARKNYMGCVGFDPNKKR